MEVRPPRKIVTIDGDVCTGKNLSVNVKESLADHPLVVGPRYQYKDISLSWAHYIGWYTSGVMVAGVGPKGGYQARQLHVGNFLRVLEIRCKMGIATDNGFYDGICVGKARYKHINKERLDWVLAKTQAEQQQMMFKTAGVDLNSQAAYDLAVGGLIRPATRETYPIIYNLKCIKFESPLFTIRVDLVNENPRYLLHLIHNLGVKLKTSIIIHGLRCTRYGNFGTESALLQKHWSLENVLKSIELCKPLVEPTKLLPALPNLSGSNDIPIDDEDSIKYGVYGRPLKM